jgi:hypothetical protein
MRPGPQRQTVGLREIAYVLLMAALVGVIFSIGAHSLGDVGAAVHVSASYGGELGG